MNKHGDNINALLDQAAGATGQERAQLDDALRRNPKLGEILGKLSDDDVTKLQGVLSDPDKTRKLLSSPQAQRLMQSLGGKKGTK